MNRLKKKDIGLILVAILVFIGVIIALVTLNKPKTPSNVIDLPEDTIKIADVMIVPNKEGLNLVNIDGTILDKVEKATLFTMSDNTNEYMYLKNNALYTSSIEENKDENGNITYSFVETKVIDVKDVSKYDFNDKYIALLTKLENIDNEINTEDISVENNDLEEENSIAKEESSIAKLVQPIEIESNSPYYNITIIDRTFNKEIAKIENVQIDDSVVFGNNFVYSIANNIYFFNFETKVTETLYLGKEVSDLKVIDTNLIVFDKFGNGQNKSLILQLDEQFKINKALKHDAPDIIEIETLEEEKDIYFVEMDKTPLLYKLNLDEEKEQRNKENLNVDIEGRYDDDNTIYAKGYVYTAAPNKITILDLKSATIHKEYDIEADFVYPVFFE